MRERVDVVMNFREWQESVPEEIRADSVWRIEAYRLALFASDIAWRDVLALSAGRRLRGLIDQLYRAVGSISANIEEGHSRGTGKDRARFYEYAFGSARETRGWYYKARHKLKTEVVQHRTALLTHAVKLLLTMVPQQCGSQIREESPEYIVKSNSTLLNEIPMP